MDENNKDTKGKVGGIIFIIWFIASFLGIMEAGRQQSIWAVVLFGQYFFVFGIVFMIVSIKNKDPFYLPLISVLVGTGVMVGSLIYKYGTDVIKEKADEIIPVILLSLFVIIGLGFLYMVYRTVFVLPNKYNHVVSATCKKVLRTRSSDEHGHKWLYCPVFTYTYNGVEYNSSDNVYTDTKYEEGEHYEINIDPDNPDKFYSPKGMGKTLILELLMGIAFTAFGLFTIFMYLTE